MTNTAVINKKQLAEWIPSKNAMCFIDRVINWDKKSIHCQSETYCQNNNPLILNNHLHIVTSIEPAAQAMAVHTALTHKNDRPQKSRQGYLASLHDIEWENNTLPKHTPFLDIVCDSLMQDDNGAMYLFKIHANSATIISGRALVMYEQE